MESKGATSNTRFGLFAIDGFSNLVSVIPIKDRTPEAMIDGLKKMFTSMGKPKQSCSDEESSMRFAKMNIFLRENETKSVQRATHVHTVKRFMKAIRLNLQRRLDA